MPMRGFPACVFAGLGALLAGCASGPHAVERVGDAVIERVDREFELPAPITRVSITNPSGEITVRARDERELGIHAVVQRLPPDHAAPRWHSRRVGDTLELSVDFVDGAPGRVDLAAYLPSELAVVLETRDGRIAAKRRTGPITARTDGGAIHASSLARLDLVSRSGAIRAAAIGRRWEGGSRLETDSGQIVALVPTFGDIVLDARTGGPLSTDFGLSVHAENAGHRAQARFGAARTPMDIRSRTGEIVLEQLVLLGDDSELPEDDD
jgi:hypothetical protein